MTTDALLGAWRARIDAAFAPTLAAFRDGDRAPPARLVEAMEHSLLAGGKRLRPLLVAAAAAAIKGTESFVDDALPAAVAVEYIHTYSLIHDDLPALDNDDWRRGRPSLHKAFDEATAILAGDALLTDAFAILACAPVNAALQVQELALAAGGAGMVGGQHDDLRTTITTVEVLADIHARKTGRLFVAACALGGLAAGGAPAQVDTLRALGRSFGLAFQIADDVLDVTGTDAAGAGGKGRGRDAKNAKVTWATLLGVDAARARAVAEAENAAALARALGSATLEALARFSASRGY